MLPARLPEYPAEQHYRHRRRYGKPIFLRTTCVKWRRLPYADRNRRPRSTNCWISFTARLPDQKPEIIPRAEIRKIYQNGHAVRCGCVRYGKKRTAR